MPPRVFPARDSVVKALAVVPQLPLGEGRPADTLGPSLGDAAGRGGRASAAVRRPLSLLRIQHLRHGHDAERARHRGG